MVSRVLRRSLSVAATLVVLVNPGIASGASRQYSSYYPNWDGNGCRNIVPSQIEWQCQAGAAMTTQTNQQYVYESVTLSVSTIGSYAPWQGSLQIIDVADSSQDCIVSIPAAAGTWECDISGAIGSELDIQVATSSPGVEIVQLAFAPLNQPTATPTDTATATGQPTDTPTATVVPGSTSTPIPTNTPRPVKTAIATDTVTPTPNPASAEYNCGDVTYPLLNCNWIGGGYQVPPDHWGLNLAGGATGDVRCTPTGFDYGPPVAAYPAVHINTLGSIYAICGQTVVVPRAGNVYIQYQASLWNNAGQAIYFQADTSVGAVQLDTSSCPPGGPQWCTLYLGTLGAGNASFSMLATISGDTSALTYVVINRVWVGTTDTPTPGTPTPVPGSPTETPLPLPFDTGTPLATGTPCPGGCSVAEATSLPGAVDTVLPIDTSPLSPLEHLSVSRTACQTFGSAPILVPSIHGTPVFGSTQPLSITWSLPVTGTTFTPCADPAFATTWWDLTWHLSIIVTFIAFLSWLIWYVRRLFT